MSAGSSTSSCVSTRRSTPRAPVRDRSAAWRFARVTDRPARPSPDGSEAKRTSSAASRSRQRGSERDTRQQRPPDYVVIGHICADILPDGTAVLGGTALYSALAAATFGWRTGILTRGRYGFNLGGLEIPPLTIGSERIQVVVQDAEWPTCFVNEYAPS